MKSPLPTPVFHRLTDFVQQLEDGVAARSHNVERAVSIDDAFDRRWVDTGLTRAVIHHVAMGYRSRGVRVEDLGNGGAEARIAFGRVDRHFRLRRAKFDADGRLDVRVSGESFLRKRADIQHSLFETDPVVLDTAEAEQWVLAYTIEPTTRTLLDVFAAYPTGYANLKSPYRLILDHVARIPLATPPTTFRGRSNEDLFGDDAIEDGGEELA